MGNNTNTNPEVLSVPWLLGTAFLFLAAAVVEKTLNIFGLSLPVVNVFPRQLLDWSVALAIFEIALTVRQVADRRA